MTEAKQPAEQTLKTCMRCKKQGDTFKVCGGCRLVYYCSPECQKEDWPTHKTLPCRSGESKAVKGRAKDLKETVLPDAKTGSAVEQSEFLMWQQANHLPFVALMHLQDTQSDENVWAVRVDKDWRVTEMWDLHKTPARKNNTVRTMIDLRERAKGIARKRFKRFCSFICLLPNDVLSTFSLEKKDEAKQVIDNHHLDAEEWKSCIASMSEVLEGKTGKDKAIEMSIKKLLSPAAKPSDAKKA